MYILYIYIIYIYYIYILYIYYTLYILYIDIDIHIDIDQLVLSYAATWDLN